MVKPDTHESLPYLLYHSTKLLCADCREVLPVIDFRPSVKDGGSQLWTHTDSHARGTFANHCGQLVFKSRGL